MKSWAYLLGSVFALSGIASIRSTFVSPTTSFVLIAQVTSENPFG
jgi:hypothetical protein